MATQADGRAGRDAAMLMLEAQWHRTPGRRRTVGADKAYNVRNFVDVVRELGTTPHSTQKVARSGGSAIDGRTTPHPGYAMSQHARPRIETGLWVAEDHPWMRKVKLRGWPRSTGCLCSRARPSICGGCQSCCLDPSDEGDMPSAGPRTCHRRRVVDPHERQ
jgi:hypothetical protein